MLRDLEGSHVAVGSIRWQHVGKRFPLTLNLLAPTTVGARINP